MKNSYRDAEDLLADESFRKWLLHPDPDTALYWDSWLAIHPEQLDAVEEARELLKSVRFEERSLSAEESQRILAYIMSNKNSSNGSTEETGAKAISLFSETPQWIKFAAVVSFLILCGSLLFLKFSQEAHVQYATSYGEIKTILLPDSSKVTLNANSKLTISESWGIGEDREVWLEGEGFFEVLKKRADAQKGQVKFVVHTQNFNVEVLGTQFNVKERATETRVVLNSGKIKLDLNNLDESRPLYMMPGESVELLKSKGIKVKKELVNPESYSSWINQKLVLDGTTVAELAHVLKDIYGLDAKFENGSTAQRVLNGTLPTDDKEALLHAISVALNVTYEVRGSEVFFMAQAK
jgi:ferric-dicitrate binding protein FerR (iron transport regulator)